MTLIGLNDFTYDDGNLPLSPQLWVKKNNNNNTFDEDTIKKIISENVKEINDKLVVSGKEVGTDNYVRSGKLNDEGTLTLNVGEDGKDVEIDFSKLKTEALSESEVNAILNKTNNK